MRSRRMVPLLALLIAAAPGAARAVPQFAVASGFACDACHVDPAGWPSPRLADRKCSLNCGACHVNPTGGGMRNEGGLYFGHQVLPLSGIRPGDTFKPSGPVPTPGSPERFAGIDPLPRVQLGADLRMMYLYDARGTGSFRDKVSIFPMQFDLHAAYSPLNPGQLNRPRLTLLMTAGAEGSRYREFNGWSDRLFIREAWALLHDLPYQLYLKAGRFQPPFGWKLDDHTAYVRQGIGFDHERTVGGVELGMNPNYLFAHIAAYSTSHFSAGGTRLGALSVDDNPATTGLSAYFGWRGLAWQAGGQYLREERDGEAIQIGGLGWSLNLMNLARSNQAPRVTYLGEVDVRWAGRTETLAILHEVDLHQSAHARLYGRYDGLDPNMDEDEDESRRVSLGIAAHPVAEVEVILAWRRNWQSGRDPDWNEVFAQLHLWH